MNKIILSCSNSNKLASLVANAAAIKNLPFVCKEYSRSERQLYLEDSSSLFGSELVIFQGLGESVNDDIYELLQAIPLVRSFKPKEITVVLPYLYYSRQANGLQLLLNLLSSLGVSEVITIDIHSENIILNAPVKITNLSTINLFANHIKETYLADTASVVIVAPDMGGVARANELAQLLGAPLIKLNKIRANENISYEQLSSELDKDKTYIIIDDIIDSGETIRLAAAVLNAAGAKRIIVYCTHGIFSIDAYKMIEDAQIETIYITNSVEFFLTHNLLIPKLKQLDISNLIAKYLKHIFNQ